MGERDGGINPAEDFPYQTGGAQDSPGIVPAHEDLTCLGLAPSQPVGSFVHLLQVILPPLFGSMKSLISRAASWRTSCLVSRRRHCSSSI